MRNKKDELKGVFFLVGAAFIWGIALVAQKAGTESLGPFSFIAIRTMMGAVTMIPIFLFFDKKKSEEQRAAEYNPKLLISGAFACSLAVTFFMVCQQIGIAYTTVGKGGFITALYIMIVPVLGIFLKRKVGIRIWICVLIAVVGFYLLCMTEGLSAINKGDLFTFFGAVGCSVHMYMLDYLVNKIDAIKFTCLQFFFVSLITAVFALTIEQPAWENVMACAIPLLYAGCCSCGLGYLFQTLGQKYLEPAKASLALSSETIFTMLAGMVFFQEIMTAKEYLGCALIFIAIIASQLEPKKKSTKKKII